MKRDKYILMIDTLSPGIMMKGGMGEFSELGRLKKYLKSSQVSTTKRWNESEFIN